MQSLISLHHWGILFKTVVLKYQHLIHALATLVLVTLTFTMLRLPILTLAMYRHWPHRDWPHFCIVYPPEQWKFFGCKILFHCQAEVAIWLIFEQKENKRIGFHFCTDIVYALTAAVLWILHLFELNWQTLFWQSGIYYVKRLVLQGENFVDIMV